MAACNGECQNDFIVIDYEGSDPEAMSMFIDVSAIVLVGETSQLKNIPCTANTNYPFGSRA